MNTRSQKLILPVVLAAGLLSLAPSPADATELGKSVLARAGSPWDEGRLIFNTRLRYEHADQDGLRAADAFTLRTRFGYETPSFEGFSALVEGEYNWVLNNGDFAVYPPPFNNGRTVIPDPETFALNRLFAAYADDGFSATVGRQGINLLNQRHIGTVGWRQNDQTYDAGRLRVTAVPDVVIDYTWNWQVNRIFGSKTPATPLRRLRTDNHFVNVLYTGMDDTTFGAYHYALRLRNLTAMSSDTTGLFVDGTHALNGDYTLLYRAEFGRQRDNRSTSGASYREDYYHLRLGARRAGFQAGIGYEELGGDGERAFQTPLATLHAFNGWADTFLTTPPDGLRDTYLWLAGPLGETKVNARFEARYFRAQYISQTYGHELGLLLTRPLTENLGALVKATRYKGREAAGPGVSADKTKIWIQFDFRL
ncbi:MAG: hypothetical protein JJU00_19305 [Opitutales bacterium]|nr:hypothetical protein [Opitutales bacterium]